jgi:hypothetical protein
MGEELQRLESRRWEWDKKVSCCNRIKKPDSKMTKRPNGDIEINVPFWLDCLYLKFKVCQSFCCRIDKEFELYHSVAKIGYANFKTDCDVINNIRRKRMHGIALHMIMPAVSRRLSAMTAFSKPLRGNQALKKLLRDPTDIKSVKGELWSFIENLEKQDYFVYALFHRY